MCSWVKGWVKLFFFSHLFLTKIWWPIDTIPFLTSFVNIWGSFLTEGSHRREISVPFKRLYFVFLCVFQHIYDQSSFFLFFQICFYNLTTIFLKCPFFVSDFIFLFQLGPVNICFVRPSLCLNWNVHSVRFTLRNTLIWQNTLKCVGLNILPFVLNYPFFACEEIKKVKIFEILWN